MKAERAAIRDSSRGSTGTLVPGRCGVRVQRTRTPSGRCSSERTHSGVDSRRPVHALDALIPLSVPSEISSHPGRTSTRPRIPGGRRGVVGGVVRFSTILRIRGEEIHTRKFGGLVAATMSLAAGHGRRRGGSEQRPDAARPRSRRPRSVHMPLSQETGDNACVAISVGRRLRRRSA